jgi:hypothetical protein
MKRSVNTTGNIQLPKRESMTSQVDKKPAGSPNMSAKNLYQQQTQPTTTALEPVKYYTIDVQLQQRLAELEAMYETQITALSSNLQEKDRYNYELAQRNREL